jgi:hypothetical protein
MSVIFRLFGIFNVDLATLALQLASFDLQISNILHPNLFYAACLSNDLDCVCYCNLGRIQNELGNIPSILNFVEQANFL